MSRLHYVIPIFAFIFLAFGLPLLSVFLFIVWVLLGQGQAAGIRAALVELFNFPALKVRKSWWSVLALSVCLVPFSAGMGHIVASFLVLWFPDGLVKLILAAETEADLAPLFNFFMLVFLVPVLSELIFRGWILRRLSLKFSRGTAALISSFIFGCFQLDPVGGLVFGVAMCILLYQSQSILFTMVCHSIHNACLWIFELYDANQIHRPLSASNIVEHYASATAMTSAIILAVLGAVILLIFYRRPTVIYFSAPSGSSPSNRQLV